CIRDDAADIVSPDVGSMHAEALHRSVEFVRECGRIKASGAWLRTANAWQIDSDGRESLRKPRHHSAIRAPLLRKPVKEEERRAASAPDVVDMGAIDRNGAR